MIYLLDVNALLALGLREHEFHERTARWVKRVAGKQETILATCAITELGFLRVLAQVPSYNFTIAQGKELLGHLKQAEGMRFSFLADGQGAADLPLWVKWPRQITDGHLVMLAKKHQAILASLDEQKRGAFVIPR